jgi:hypothetical protein
MVVFNQKVIGSCEFTSDIHHPKILIDKALYLKHPRARTRRLDVSAAEADIEAIEQYS